ncbi:Arc family DNA-binding protein [Tianweitania sp. BSSL-BM11]|uniref:Arc family DNA-binding protein n=1 Tax=Tianweitania aestuarii TaxID=2814886 RepID=A0ABS5RTV8_9HYPH|nr:Arc family DNA-binding protein [Tianweitania aestuarii]MBS9720245.1 Arc family DNA-binding protein [Tianweitania aestuarii]
MAKKTLARDQDKFMLRLPEGMRERIKAKADRAGMSMNEAIVFCLDAWFPAPKTLQEKINELASLVALLKRGNDLEEQVDSLISEIDTTLREVADNVLPASEGFQSRVVRQIEEWDEDEAHRLNDEAYNPFDDENYPTVGGVPIEELDYEAGPSDPDDPFSLPPRKKKP